ncbi:activating signal cointegrator 1 complex subunit 2 homolog [Cloeon dipterum]|uniref:activating signal cointegrator 1 complex subunit 2 homolog n=1 Tax=Cloeon dipterum TaxID=197152 RepID=UPI0032200D2C
MQLVLVVSVVCAVIAGVESYVPLSAYTKISSTTATPFSRVENGTEEEKTSESPWEEKIVYGDNEISVNKRVNDRFLDKEEKPVAAGSRNKRQPEITRLPSESTQAKSAIANVESVIRHVEDVIDEYRNRDAKRTRTRIEHRENSFELPSTDRKAKQQNFEPESRIINRNPQPEVSSPNYSGFRPMTSIGNRLATYVNPSQNNPFVTGSPAPFVSPQQQQQQYYYVPSRQPYAGSPFSQSEFTFPEPQRQPQTAYNFPQQRQPQTVYNFPQQPQPQPQQVYYPSYFQPSPQPYYQYQRNNYPTQLVTHHIPITIAIPLPNPFEQQVHDPHASRRINSPPSQSVAVTVQRPSQTPILDRVRSPSQSSRRPAQLSVNIFRQK